MRVNNFLKEIRTGSLEFQRRGKKTVVVQGLGFVGTAVAAVIAGSRNETGEPQYFVIGVDLPSEDGYRKVAALRRGEIQAGSPDPELSRLIRQAVLDEKNLYATVSDEVYSLADFIVMDVPLDVEDRFTEKADNIRVGIESFKTAVQVVGRNMKPDALVLVETTVPPGTCEHVILPELISQRSQRGIEEPPLLAHAYERVMPGAEYVSSIRSFWRTITGIDERSVRIAREFLSSFIDTREHPFTELQDTTSSELAKLLENSYRAANIAFIHEWTLTAEKLGIDLFSVIDSIRVRKGTHDNMRYPGFGVGGYCLTKDSLLAQWSLENLFGSDHRLGMTLDAIAINNRMPLHTLDLLIDLAGGSVKDRTIAILGITYLPQVADTRNSPAEILVDALVDEGAEVIIHDPCLRSWVERPDIEFIQNLHQCLERADGIVFAVPHREYLELGIEDILVVSDRKPFIVDARNIVNDKKAEALHNAGCRLLGVGKGHWRKKGFQTCQEKY